MIRDNNVDECGLMAKNGLVYRVVVPNAPTLPWSTQSSTTHEPTTATGFPLKRELASFFTRLVLLELGTITGSRHDDCHRATTAPGQPTPSLECSTGAVIAAVRA